MKIANGDKLEHLKGSDPTSSEVKAVETPGLIEKNKAFQKEAELNRNYLKYTGLGFLALLISVLVVYPFMRSTAPTLATPIPVRSITAYINSFSERNPESSVGFVQQDAIDGLPGNVGVAYAKSPDNQANLVVFEFETDAQAQKAMAKYTQGMNAMIENNLIIAAPTGELRPEYTKALNPY